MPSGHATTGARVRANYKEGQRREHEGTSTWRDVGAVAVGAEERVGGGRTDAARADESVGVVPALAEAGGADGPFFCKTAMKKPERPPPAKR